MKIAIWWGICVLLLLPMQSQAKSTDSAKPRKQGAKKSGRWSQVERMYRRLEKQRRGLRPHLLRLALRAYTRGWERKELTRPILSVIDYSLHSKHRRMWIFDMQKYRLLWHEWVTHGSGSGDGKGNAVRFSNQPNSLATSLGLFRVGVLYYGKYGVSLRLHGLEHSINHHALRRAVVIHGADYAHPSLIKKQGRLGQSWGCPSLRKPIHKIIIPHLANGSALFAYYPQRAWLQQSRYLR